MKRINCLSVELMNYYPDIIKSLWVPTRNCYFKDGFNELEKTYDKDKAITLLKSIYKKGHLSIFEMAPFQFKISGASRSLLSQLTRHRVGWSFAVQSQHYQKHNDFYYKDLEQYINDEHKQKYYDLMDKINDFYINCLNNNIPKYIAREVLPNSTSVHLVVGTNLRALDNFWRLRKGSENTPEIRLLSNLFYQEVQNVFPELNKIIDY